MKRITIILCIMCLFFCQNAISAKDELQSQYIDKLREINFELKKSQQDRIRIMKITNLDLEFGRNTLKHEAEYKEIIGKIDILKKEQSNLKTDALKYFKGKMPRSLSLKWEEEDSNYKDFEKTKITPELEKINKELKKMMMKH